MSRSLGNLIPYFILRPSSFDGTYLGSLQEAAGINCMQGNERVLPWTTLDKELLRIGCYIAGWPDICLPEKATRFPNQISPSSHPDYWWLYKWLALEIQIYKGAVKVLPRPEGTLNICRIDD